MYKKNINYIIATIFVSLTALTIGKANADDIFQNSYPKSRKTSKDWDITMGLGEGFSQRYEGSDDRSFSTVPYFEIIWKDRVTLDPTGLDAAIIHSDKYEAGLGIAYDGGRDDKSSHNPFGSSDDKLNGMGSIDPSLGLRAFASYEIEPLEFHSSITRFIGAQNDGILIGIGSSATLPVSKKFIVTPKIDVSWADQSYMQTYFGVSPPQSSRTNFHKFTAESGFKDVAAGVNLTYMLDDNQNWFLSQDINITQLLEDAEKSPIVESQTGITLVTMIGYHF